LNAGRLLRETGLDSEDLRELIAPVEPGSVNVWPASRWIRSLWRPGIKGVTHWKWILVDPDYLRSDPDRLARLVVHELVHVRQYVEGGYLRFMSRYLSDYWRGRISGKSPHEAYLGIRAEVEAREVTARVVAAI
jgi:hypothetical protein